MKRHKKKKENITKIKNKRYTTGNANIKKQVIAYSWGLPVWDIVARETQQVAAYKTIQIKLQVAPRTLYD